jgi:glycosyltransferase involved in cell wall biosynthesis
MRGLVTRLRFELEDQLRFSTMAHRFFSRRWRRQGLAMPDATDQQRINRVKKLCSAATLSPDRNARRNIETMILETVASIDGSSIDWSETYPDIGNPHLHSAAILKPYVSPREKGVVIISFEKQWIKLLIRGNAREIADRYTVIIGPSWTPPHTCGVTIFPKLFPEPVFSTISHDNDMTTLPRLSNRITPVPLLASNWVNPSDFAPLPQDQRDIDVVMVATFGKYKRHHALLKALARMPRTIRVQLVGTDNDDLGASGVHKLACAYGVEDRLVAVGAENYDGVARAFCRAKVSVIMSRREGSCQAVIESMFADTPVGILENAELGSAKYVNDHTGRMLREEHLAEDIMDMLARAASFGPRSWVMANKVSCYDSTRALNDFLRDHARRAGQEWTRDIVGHAWNPYPELLPEDRGSMAPAYRDMFDRFGLKIGPDSQRWQSPESVAALKGAAPAM